MEVMWYLLMCFTFTECYLISLRSFFNVHPKGLNQIYKYFYSNFHLLSQCFWMGQKSTSWCKIGAGFWPWLLGGEVWWIETAQVIFESKSDVGIVSMCRSGFVRHLNLRTFQLHSSQKISRGDREAERARSAQRSARAGRIAHGQEIAFRFSLTNCITMGYHPSLAWFYDVTTCL